MLNYPTTKDIFTCLDLSDDLDSTLKNSLGIQDPINFEEACSTGTYKVVFCVDTNGHMHWYRQDSNGLWSHKDGDDYIVQRDLDGNLIFDPRTCASNYTYIGCFEAEPWQ